MRGCGKSYLGDMLLRDESRVFVYDTMGEYNNGVVFYSMQRLAEYWEHVKAKPFRIIYRPMDPAGEFPAICELVWLCGNVCFMVEEVHTFCQPHCIPSQFLAILTRGRHQRIKLLAVTQRPRGIDHTLTAMTKEAFIFQTREPDDRKYLENWLGNGIGEKFDTLQQFEYIHWQDDKPGIFEVGKA